MELKSLFVGIVFALGMFALKSGIGLHYVIRRKGAPGSKVFLVVAFGCVYLLLFYCCARTLQRIDLIAHYPTVQNFIQSGMLVHIAMAAGFVIWGIALLKRGRHSRKPTFSWLALIIPCPVCMTVIFMSTAFLLAVFPDAGLKAVGFAYLTFMAITTVTAVGMTVWRIASTSSPESDMGAAMLFIAAYFILSVIVMPQFGDVDKIYRIARYKSEKAPLKLRELLLLLAVTAGLFSAGYLSAIQKVKRYPFRALKNRIGNFFSEKTAGESP